MSTAPSPPATALRRNALANIAGRAASALVWVAVTPYALGRLGPERFGVWSLFFALSGYLAALDFGMASVVARYVALGAAKDEGGTVRAVIARSLAVSLGLGAVWAAGCGLLGGPFCHAFHVPAALGPEVVSALTVFGLSIAVFSMAQVGQGALTGLQRLDLANLALLAGLAVQVAVLLVGLARGGGLMAAAWSAVTGQATMGLASWSLVRGRLRTLPAGGGVAGAPWRSLLGFGGTVQVTNALIVGQMQVGKFVLGALGSLAAVTTFELAFRATNAVWSLPLLAQAAIVPAAARASAAGEGAALGEVYRWGVRWIVMLAGVALAGLALVAGPLFTLWLGPGHAETVRVARVLAVAFALGTPAIPANALARGAGRPSFETAGFAAALAVNLAALFVLVPRGGPVGAAVAMALSLTAMWVTLAGLTVRWLRGDAARALTLALPRLALPALAAAAVAWATAGFTPAGRGGAFALLALQGAAFVALWIPLALVTGDPQALWRWTLGHLPGRTVVAGGAGLPS